METKLSRTINELEGERAELLLRVARYDRAIQALREEQSFIDEKVDPLEGLPLAPRESETRSLRVLVESTTTTERHETPPPPPSLSLPPPPPVPNVLELNGDIGRVVAAVMRLPAPATSREVHNFLRRRGSKWSSSVSYTQSLLQKAVERDYLKRSGDRGSYRYEPAAAA